MSTDPTADQLAAAIAHTARVMAGHAPIAAATPVAGPIVDRLTDWHYATAAAEQSRFCAHLRRGGPQPAFGFLALPGELACARCMPHLRASYSRRIPDDQCDACRRSAVIAGELSIHPPGTTVILTGDVCNDCHAAAYPDARPPADVRASAADRYAEHLASTGVSPAVFYTRDPDGTVVEHHVGSTSDAMAYFTKGDQ